MNRRERLLYNVASTQWPHVYISLIGVILLLLPLMAFMGVVDALWAFRAGVTVLSLAWSVTWLGVGMVFFQRTRRAGVYWICIGLILGAIFMGIGYYLQAFPRIHDISNDLDDPPTFIEAGPKGSTFPEENKALIQKAYPFLRPVVVKGSPEEVWAKALKVVSTQKRWTISHIREDERRVQVEARTRIFGFVDDMIIEVRTLSDQLQIVRARSRSRVGKSDLGANARRLKLFSDRMTSP